ncbi:tetranectin-like [Anguilla rostrata]|uniref:C-type lectin domain-containing protein n=1 Tax=Anguilla anguilla TaxID=7936 RepID=A0A9D3M7T7_ANGAN|nr:tetranectin-like [Anguilla anguilla]KAG5842380.1 hypothetical protein ANANG_G00177040 [Anguilla anguilla]
MDLKGACFVLCLLFLIHSSLQQSTPKKKTLRKESAKPSDIEELQKKVEEISKELLLLKEQQALQTVCLKGVKIHGKCFLADTEKKSFHTASEDCISKGGILSTPTSSEENDQLNDYVQKSIGRDTKIWLGINDMMTEGRWHDLTGSDVTYTNWETNQKPGSNPSQNCAVLSSASKGKWSDESCRADKAFVCQFNIV